MIHNRRKYPLLRLAVYHIVDRLARSWPTKRTPASDRPPANEWQGDD